MPVRYGYRVEMKFPKEPWWSYAAWAATEEDANEVAGRCTYPGAKVRVRPNPDPPFYPQNRLVLECYQGTNKEGIRKL